MIDLERVAERLREDTDGGLDEISAKALARVAALTVLEQLLGEADGDAWSAAGDVLNRYGVDPEQHHYGTSGIGAEVADAFIRAIKTKLECQP